ncbi:DUF2599 domain-containing protein [Streptomyces sp. NPDC048248]|uniref:DUF2599 domain-containing protein n=1 Tax=Streptomyces sp. NPDC048248 TaxID=3365523 RepID=UPI0037222C7A
MTTSTARLRRRTALFKGAAAVLAAALAVLTVQAAPAAAAKVCENHQVGGDILQKYRDIGGETSPLGCPTSDELTTPNGRGKYNTFDGGSIYWTATTGAHPVWGAVRDKWGALGWEGGKLGFPVGDELTNSDGQGRRQQFEGGTVYWHPTLSDGAHPVWGRIGEQWGVYGWENGPFGYPTTDEVWNAEINGFLQGFSTHRSLMWWSAGMGGDHNGVCTGECTGYKALSNSEWVTKTEVSRRVENGDIDIKVFPTDAGFDDADTDYDALWEQSFSSVPVPKGLTEEQRASLHKQLACHAHHAYNGGDGTTGPSWDLESWRPDVSWDYALSHVTFPLHLCNWE